MRQYSSRLMRLVGIVFFLTAGMAVAGEYAVLASGARLRVDKHEADGVKVRLYHDGGMIEMNASDVRGFEWEEEAPAPVATAPGPIPKTPPNEPTKQLSPLELADAAADKYGLPRALVRSVMAAESGGQAQAVSAKGAIGLMQLMPETARDLGADPWDPAQNVDAGTRYLRDLLDKYNGGLWHALAAYNAGPGTVDKYHGVPPYSETVRYVGKIQKRAGY